MSHRRRGAVCVLFVTLVSFHGAIAQQGNRRNNPFDDWDKNQDGLVSRDEFADRFPADQFDDVNTNGDAYISRQEEQTYRLRSRSTKQPLPKHVTVLREVNYASVGKRQLPLDLYLHQEAKAPVPLVIWIHGGAWRGGSKNGIRQCMALLERGYAVASVEYRLSGEAIFPAATEDCKAAVSFLRFHAEKYHVDPNRFGAWGSSAGGHLVALLGTTNDVKDFDTHAICKQAPPTVQAVCNWFGPTDFLRMNDFPGSIDHDSPNSPESRFIGVPIQDHPAKTQRANPITYISQSDPPMLLMHGDKDRAVPFNQSELLHDALRKAGVPSTLYKVTNGGHGFRQADASREALLDMTVDFFDAQLRGNEKHD